MLILEQLPSDDVSHLSASTGIPEDRIKTLQSGVASPSIGEIGRLSDALDIDPIHLFRESPVVAANRAGTELQASYGTLLVALDLHIAAYADSLEQSVGPGFPASSARGARASGEGWATQQHARGYSAEGPDPLISAVEAGMGIPVLIWPIPDAPFGATVRYGDVVGIWVNSSGVPGPQQRFTLAHEVGHINLRHVHDVLIELATSVARAEVNARGSRANEERHAQNFAAGVLCDYATITENWDGESTRASAARLASALGASYEATVYAMRHHRLISDDEHAAFAGASVRQSFQEADFEQEYLHFEAQRNRKRVPAILPEPEILEQSLELAVSGDHR